MKTYLQTLVLCLKTIMGLLDVFLCLFVLRVAPVLCLTVLFTFLYIIFPCEKIRDWMTQLEKIIIDLRDDL